jgi:hypothetical protein
MSDALLIVSGMQREALRNEPRGVAAYAGDLAAALATVALVGSVLFWAKLLEALQ